MQELSGDLTAHPASGQPAARDRQRTAVCAWCLPVSKGQNRKRVRPPGPAARVTIAERGSMRYTFRGGGPCDGALKGGSDAAPAVVGSGRPALVRPRLRDTRQSARLGHPDSVTFDDDV